MACGRFFELNLFAAIFNDDGMPIDPALGAEPLGASRHVAFLCASEGASRIAGEDCRVTALGEHLWVAGRIRLDGRADLVARLGAAGGGAVASDGDAMLCLRAYAVWGERFTDVIAGDFSFVLWDAGNNHLLAVRDQLGKRPLFHARAHNTWLVSDSLDWIAGKLRAQALDDYWIADFLTVGFSLEFERTVYRDIHRLAPAHLLSLRAKRAAVRRYWRLDVAEPLYLPRAEAYAERFRDLLSRAVADRSLDGHLGVALSGGLDSTTLAAIAVETLGNGHVMAACESHRVLLGSDEDHYAGLVARKLGIELRVENAESLAYDPCWNSRSIWHAEPTVYFINAQPYRLYYGELSRRAPVWLHGEGPDNALAFDRDAYLAHLWRRRDFGKLAGALIDYAHLKGGEGWMASVRRRLQPRAAALQPRSMPPWLDRGLVQRCHLIERSQDLGARRDAPHAWHPAAMASFASPIWASHFDDFVFLESLAPLVWRHPYLDLRVLRFMLSMPPIPWAWKKRLLRVAMRGRLPEQILYRDKAALPRGPHIALIERYGFPAIERCGAFDHYVDASVLCCRPASDEEIDQAIAPHVLAHWLALRQQTLQS